MRLFAPAFALVALVAMAAPAQAALVLTIEDLDVPGSLIIIVDDSAIGTGTTKGLSTTVDAFGGSGVIMFSGTVGGFMVQVSTGLSKPLLGQPALAHLKLSNSSTGIGHLVVSRYRG